MSRQILLRSGAPSRSGQGGVDSATPLYTSSVLPSCSTPATRTFCAAALRPSHIGECSRSHAHIKITTRQYVTGDGTHIFTKHAFKVGSQGDPTKSGTLGTLTNPSSHRATPAPRTRQPPSLHQPPRSRRAASPHPAPRQSGRRVRDVSVSWFRANILHPRRERSSISNQMSVTTCRSMRITPSRKASSSSRRTARK